MNSTEYNKKYYLKHRQTTLEKRKEIKYCGACMSFYPIDYVMKHNKTKKHLKCFVSLSLC